MGITALAALFLITFFVRQTYFFNPFTFKQDEITHLSWTWYKRPVTIDYVLWDPKEVRVIDSPSQIHQVIRELRNGLHRQTTGTSCASEEAGPRYALYLQGKDATLMSLQGCKHDGVVMLSTPRGDVPVVLSDELRALLTEWERYPPVP